MWFCECGGKNSVRKSWCSSCNLHFTHVQYWEEEPQSKNKNANRSAPWTPRGRSQSQKPKRPDARLSAFQPFTKESKNAPWLESTPTSRMSKIPEPDSGPSGKMDKNKRAMKEDEKEEASTMNQKYVQALLESEAPEAVKEALKKWTQQETSVTHTDLNRLNKLKNQAAKQRQEVVSLDAQWTEFSKLSKENWTTQKERYLERRQVALKSYKEIKEKLAAQQKIVADRAAKAEETKDEEEIEDLEEENEEEIEEEEMDLEPLEGEGSPKKKRSALTPFGGPLKQQKT